MAPLYVQFKNSIKRRAYSFAVIHSKWKLNKIKEEKNAE